MFKINGTSNDSVMILYTAHTLMETLFVNMTKKQMQELHALT